MKRNLTEAFSLHTHGFSATQKKSRKTVTLNNFDLASLTSWARTHDVALMGVLSISAITILPLLVVALVAWMARS